MKMRFKKLFILGLTFAMAISSVVLSQTQIKIPITASNLNTARTINFGWDLQADHCIDAVLGEMEYPPKPPTPVFDFRFVDIRVPSCLGQGMVLDLRKLITTQTLQDTFVLSIQHGEGGIPIDLSWPVINNPLIKGLIMQDGLGGIYFSINMLASQSVVIDNANITTVYIYSSTGTNIKQEGKTPQKFTLEQNYPNPFNPSTTIKFSITSPSVIDLIIFDIMGRKVKTLITDQINIGKYSIEWDGMDVNGLSIASGIYTIRLNAKTEEGKIFSESKKILLLK